LSNCTLWTIHIDFDRHFAPYDEIGDHSLLSWTLWNRDV